MERQLLQVLEQRAASPVHHALGQTRGAGRVHDVERVIERKPGERRLREPVTPGEKLGPENRARHFIQSRCAGKVWHHHDALDGGNSLAHGAHPLQQVDRLAGVPVAIHGYQHPRRDLPEPVHHALHAEIGRARGPDGAKRCGAQHGNDGLGKIGQVAGDAVALLDARRRECGRGARYLDPQLGERQP